MAINVMKVKTPARTLLRLDRKECSLDTKNVPSIPTVHKDWDRLTVYGQRLYDG